MTSEAGGYDYKFADTPPDRYVCNICHLPSRSPYLTTCCGHVFCKSCLENAERFTTPTENVCPMCRDEEFVTFPNKQLNREVKALYVMCTNNEVGCEWRGELNDINTHLKNSDGCQFEYTMCSNGCDEMIQRQHLTKHVEYECPCRVVDCQYCHISGEHWVIEGEHKEECPKVNLPCPNRCEVESILRENMEAHRKICPLEKVECSNVCGTVLQQQNLSEHIEKSCMRHKVDCQYCHITDERWYIEEEHRNHCPKLPLPCPNECEVDSIPREDMEAHRNECPLEVVQCEYRSVGCTAEITRASKRKHEEENTEEHLLMTRVKLAKTETRLASLEVMVHRLINSTGSSNRLIDSSQWSSHLTTMSKKVAAIQICPVIIKMVKFSHNKEEDVVWHSNSFFSHSKGYKMSLRVDAAGNGDEKYTHMSVFLFLMKGPYDDSLTWPLRGMFQFKLLNQISDCQHYSETLTYSARSSIDSTSRVTSSDRARSGWGLPDFISHTYLNKVTPTCQYLKDDCIFLQVSKL